MILGHNEFVKMNNNKEKYSIMLIITTIQGGITSQIVPGYYSSYEETKENVDIIITHFYSKSYNGTLTYLILPYKN